MTVIGRDDRWRGSGTGFERYDHAGQEAALARIDVLARVMDSAICIPGTKVTFGLDAALGLIPVVGDLVAQTIASYIIWEARKLGVSRWTIMRMVANTLVDTAIGAVPVVGDAFDVVFRANLRNLALLKAELQRKGAGRPVIDV